MQENHVTASPVLLNRILGGLYHRLGALPTPTRVRAVVRGGCAVLGVPQPLLSIAEVEDIPQYTCVQVSAPEDADAFPNSLRSIQSPSLPSRLLLPPTPSIALCMGFFLHAGILRNAWGAPDFASPARLPRAEAVGVAVGTAAWAPGAGGAPHRGASDAPANAGPQPILPGSPRGLVKRGPGGAPATEAALGGWTRAGSVPSVLHFSQRLASVGKTTNTGQLNWGWNKRKAALAGFCRALLSLMILLWVWSRKCFSHCMCYCRDFISNLCFSLEKTLTLSFLIDR